MLRPRFEDGRTQSKMLACQEIVDQASLAIGGHSLRTALWEAALPQTHLDTAHTLAGEAREAGERTRTREKPPHRGPAKSDGVLPTGHREAVTQQLDGGSLIVRLGLAITMSALGLPLRIVYCQSISAVEVDSRRSRHLPTRAGVGPASRKAPPDASARRALGPSHCLPALRLYRSQRSRRIPAGSSIERMGDGEQ